MPPPLPMPTVALPYGQPVPALGLGTWHMGERSSEAPSTQNLQSCGT